MIMSASELPPPSLVTLPPVGRVRSISLRTPLNGVSDSTGSIGAAELPRSASARTGSRVAAAERKTQRRLTKRRAKLMRKLNAIEQEMEVVELHIDAATTQVREIGARGVSG